MTSHDLPTDPATISLVEADLHDALTAVQSVEARCKDAFLPHLRAHGITRVEIHYDGGGDEGTVGEVSAYTQDGDAELPHILCDHHSLEYSGEVKIRTIDLEDALSAFAENAVCARHAGWEDGEGACGTIAIDVGSGAVTLTHNSRFIDYETSEAEL
ncbi:DUF6878 family protein [Novosphingobium album (ex Liu et al. 2023)]|uniref:DUF6878 domain-containing protein n=1 Tax=Novosphingobium album (ex Liu et al. 2023) TaxID=3031130 RepID=A0ABT5WKL5_9SPHN|nr:DUF6878 family protein [Novosphingobium album (ex Liu et al. 2023)]MDE8650590.1 hypothetical protein [Novosphingobium album (ex Liu et al. 2023)]